MRGPRSDFSMTAPLHPRPLAGDRSSAREQFINERPPRRAVRQPIPGRRPGLTGATVRPGFTVIELLVVISIIILLIAMLLPSLRKGRTVARSAVCMKKLEQLGNTIFQYANDNDGRIFPYEKEPCGSNWCLRYDTFWMTLTEPYHNGDDDVRVCPETVVDPLQQFNYSTGMKQPYTLWGTVDVAWGRPDTPVGFLGTNVGSYAWNSWMHGGRDYPISSNPDVEAADNNRHWHQFARIRTASTTPMFTDGMWVDTWFQNSSTSVSQPPPHLRGWNSAAGRVVLDRHDWAVNHVYADGSAGRTELDELWQLTWNTESVPQDPPFDVPDQ